MSNPQDGYVFTVTANSGNWQQPIQNTGLNSTPYYINGSGYIPIQISLPNISIDLGIPETEVSPSGCSCKRCKEFNEWAQPNRSDKSFICWACSHGY